MQKANSQAKTYKSQIKQQIAQDQQVYSFKKLTFNCSLGKKTLLDLQKKGGISYHLFNDQFVNLSGKYYDNWVYKKSEKDIRQIQQPFINKKNQLNYEDSQKQQKTLFIKLIKKTEWRYLSINFQRKSNLNQINLFKELCFIQFLKLTKLQLIGNKITSIEIIQTMNLPNISQISLDFNQITNLKSLSKINSKQLTIISFKANFLNSQNTFEGLTKLDSQKLKQAYFQMQGDSSFFQQIQNQANINNFVPIEQRPLNNQQKQQQFSELIEKKENYVYNKELRMNILLDFTYRERLKRPSLQFQLKRINYSKYPKHQIQMQRYLLKQQLNSMQDKFLLKSNSQTEQLLNYQSNKYSPYQYFIDYGTNISKLTEQYQNFLQIQAQIYAQIYGNDECVWVCPNCRYQQCICQF